MQREVEREGVVDVGSVRVVPCRVPALTVLPARGSRRQQDSIFVDLVIVVALLSRASLGPFFVCPGSQIVSDQAWSVSTRE